MALTFPRSILTPKDEGWVKSGMAQSGPRSLAGISQTVESTGGGYWTWQGTFWIRTPEHKRLWSRLEGLLSGGAAAIVMPMGDLRQAPRPWAGGRPMKPAAAAPVTDPLFRDLGFGSTLMEATISANAALRATTVDISITKGMALQGGEHFGIDHADAGPRIYCITRMVDANTAKIWPPLRQAVTSGTAINFDEPGCLMKLNGSMALMLNGNRHGEATLNLEEAFGVDALT